MGRTAEVTRARLLDAAVAAFAEKGFHGTTTRDIATAAGMSPAALYVHHKSKEELLYLISRSGHEHTMGIVRDGIAVSPDPVEQLRTVVYTFAVHHARGHTGARIVNYELAALDHGHLQEIKAMRSEIDREISGIVQRGIDAGVFRSSAPRMAAVAIQSLGIDIARWYRDDGAWTPEDLGTYYADMALRIVEAR